METQQICAQCGRALVAGSGDRCNHCAANPSPELAEPTLPLRCGSIYGDYELLQELGRGGMGIVFKARQISLNRVVAYKTILPGHLTTAVELRRFHHEALTAAVLEHANIVTVFETGEYHGRPYMSMPYIPGIPLSKMSVPLLNHEAARLLLTVAAAVQFAHQHGIVHRDLKPGNILIDYSGTPHITDFGLAKHLHLNVSFTMTGMVAGTPGYIAPEEACGDQEYPTVASDIFSLGAVLYFMLTGTAPFAAKSPMESICWTIERDPISPTALNKAVDPRLEAICLKCLQKQPLLRYRSAAELTEDLERWLRGESLRLTPGKYLQHLSHWSQRNPWAIAGFSTIIFLGALAVIYGLYSQKLFLQDLLNYAYPRESPPHWLDPLPIGASSPLWSFLLGLFPLAWFHERKRLGRLVPCWLYAAGAVAELLAGSYLIIKFIDAKVWQILHVWYSQPVVFLPAFTFFWFGSRLMRELFRERSLARLHIRLPSSTSLLKPRLRKEAILMGSFVTACLTLLLLVLLLVPDSSPKPLQIWTLHTPVFLFLTVWIPWLVLSSWTAAPFRRLISR